MNTAAYWIRPSVESNAWLYRPGTFPEQSRAALQAQGWQRVRSAYRLAHYCGQLVEVRQSTEQEKTEYWVDALDYYRPSVALGLTLPQWAWERMSVDEPVLSIANPLPPPQIGEVALVETRQGHWQLYTLSELGDEALDLWRRLGSALKTVSAPAEWWLVTPLLTACMAGQQDHLRMLLRRQIQQSLGEEQQKLKAQMAALDQAAKQARALRFSREHAQQHSTSTQAQWRQIRELAGALAQRYWDYHRQGGHKPPSIAGTRKPQALLPGRSEGEGYLDVLEQIVPSPPLEWVQTPAYAEDNVVRQALLAPAAWEKKGDQWEYSTSLTGDLACYFLDREHPMPLSEIQAQLLRVHKSLALTIRIVLSLWYQRFQTQPEFCRDGKAGMKYDEILLWHGSERLGRAVYPGANSQYTEGFTRKAKEHIRKNLDLARCIYVRGSHTVIRQDCEETVTIDDPYLLISFVSRPVPSGPEELLGVFAGPGPWITNYQGSDHASIAVMNRRLLSLNPQNEQHEVQIALFLMERWLLLSKRQKNFTDPISMQQLLHGSVIPIDHPNVSGRFATRIEDALEVLKRKGIIGSYRCLTPFDKTGYWGKRWLASLWCFLPPNGVTHNYRQIPGQQNTGIPDSSK